MSRTKYLSADERRVVTVEAVVALAGEQNPSEITTAAIAKRMRLTQGALFRHFASKEALWAAVMDWVAERLLGGVDRATASASGPVAALEAVFTNHVEFVISHPGVPRMVFGELQRAESTPAKQAVQALLRRYAERVRALIELGKAQGALSAEVEPADAATLFIGMIQGLVMQSLLAGDPALIRAHAPSAFTIYLRGLGGAR